MSRFTASDLVPGRSYRVIAEFLDYDGGRHGVGECWCFVRKNFIPYEDGLSLFVEDGQGTETQIRLQWLPASQSAIIENFSDFVVET